MEYNKTDVRSNGMHSTWYCRSAHKMSYYRNRATSKVKNISRTYCQTVAYSSAAVKSGRNLISRSNFRPRRLKNIFTATELSHFKKSNCIWHHSYLPNVVLYWVELLSPFDHQHNSKFHMGLKTNKNEYKKIHMNGW